MHTNKLIFPWFLIIASEHTVENSVFDVTIHGTYITCTCQSVDSTNESTHTNFAIVFRSFVIPTTTN